MRTPGGRFLAKRRTGAGCIMTQLTVVAGGQSRRFTAHATEQILAREINTDWIVESLENPVVVIDDEFHNSFNYYGRIDGRNSLLKVAISKWDLGLIVTVYFDSVATRRRQRGQL